MSDQKPVFGLVESAFRPNAYLDSLPIPEECETGIYCYERERLNTFTDLTRKNRNYEFWINCRLQNSDQPSQMKCFGFMDANKTSPEEARHVCNLLFGLWCKRQVEAFDAIRMEQERWGVH